MTEVKKAYGQHIQSFVVIERWYFQCKEKYASFEGQRPEGIVFILLHVYLNTVLPHKKPLPCPFKIVVDAHSTQEYLNL
jgi:hypothetical protein